MSLDRMRSDQFRRPKNEGESRQSLPPLELKRTDEQPPVARRPRPVAKETTRTTARAGLVAALSTHAGLRQAILLNEILGKPRGLQSQQHPEDTYGPR